MSRLRHVRAISLDVTGTLIRHLDPIPETYCQALVWSGFPHRLTPAELKAPFKAAYRKTLEDFPCFGATAGLSSRQWWVRCVKRCLAEAGLDEEGVPSRAPGDVRGTYSSAEFNRWFRRVYQHYGCPAGYVPMPDALPFLKWATEQGFLLGVTTNTPSRTMDSVLPFMGLHQYFRCFTCSQDVGVEKPDRGIFDHSFAEMRTAASMISGSAGGAEGAFCDEVREFDPESFNRARVQLVNRYERLLRAAGELQPDQVLHVGDSLAADLCGPRAAGWLGVHVDRSSDPNVRVYQDWLEGPDYEGKSESDVRENTVFSLADVRLMLENSM
mmetsp:Transcript_121387/g.329625  ORF Transcript_121387/g.329625 Transcript_121387/m.329625 type:complete len:327 (+) Transcript_121387:52-1032(+)